MNFSKMRQKTKSEKEIEKIHLKISKIEFPFATKTKSNFYRMNQKTPYDDPKNENSVTDLESDQSDIFVDPDHRKDNLQEDYDQIVKLKNK